MLSFRFYFPNGNPSGKLSVDGVCKKFSEAFSKNKQSSVTTEQLGHTLKVSADISEEYGHYLMSDNNPVYRELADKNIVVSHFYLFLKP